MKKSLLFFSVMLWLSASYAQLSGTYTVYGATPDYPTIQAACTDLETLGQSGAVIFDVRDGNYSEVITLNAVAGNSATNTVTFQSESADSTLVNVASSIGNVFTFTDVNYVHFNHISISYTGTSGDVVRFNNGGNGSVFNNVALLSSSTSSGTYALYVDRDAGVNDFEFINSSVNSMANGIHLNSDVTNVNNCKVDNSNLSSINNALFINAEKYANNASILNSDISATSGRALSLYGSDGSADNLIISNSSLSSVSDYAFEGYSEFTMNNGLIENSDFYSENGYGVYIEGYYGSVSDWTVTNSKFTAKYDAFYAYSDQTISNMTFVNDSLIVNPLGLCCSYGDALKIRGYALTQNIDIHDNYIYTDSATYGDYGIELYAGDGSLLDVMCYNNEVKSRYGFYFRADAIASNWWIDNNEISTRYESMDLDMGYGSGSDVVIINNNIESGDSYGIDWDCDGPLSDIRIDSNIVVSEDESIYIYGSADINNIQLKDNQITSLNDDAFYLRSNAIIHKLEISGNTIVSDNYGMDIEGDGGLTEVNIDNNTVDADSYGVYLEADNVITAADVTNNTINAYYTAVYIEGYYGGLDDILIDNNFAYSENDDGIYLTSYSTISNTTITNNEVYADTVNCCDAAIYIESDDANMENVTVSNNEVYAYYNGIYLEADYGNAANCVVENNDAWVGEYGIYFDGAGSKTEIRFNNIFPLQPTNTQFYSGIYAYGNGGPNSGLTISNNYIDNVDGYGIEAYYYKDLVIENNEIRSDESDQNLYGIYCEYISGSSRINANKILTDSEYDGIILYYSNGSAANPIVISNNFVSGFEYSFDIEYSAYVDLIHNSVSTPINNQMVYIENVTDMNILNNIFKSSNTSGEIYWGNTSNANIMIDYNAYDYDSLVANMSADAFFGTNTSLFDLQTNYGAGANSMNADPMFINDTLDLHIPCGNAVLSAGIVTAVVVDVDGGARNLTTPTIGAHEIIPGPTDVLADSAFFCLSAELLSNATGTYQWSTGETTQMISVNTVGTYYCTVTDGCGNVSNDSIVVWTDNPTANFLWGLNGYQGVFNNTSTGGTSYSWDFGDQSTSTEMNPIHNYGSEDASYTVVLTVTNDCGGIDTYTQTVTVSNLEIEEESLEARGFSIYPNPTQGDVTIDFALLQGENINMFLLDMNGRVVFADVITNEVGSFQKKLSISELANGMNTDSESITKRIVKQ